MLRDVLLVCRCVLSVVIVSLAIWSFAIVGLDDQQCTPSPRLTFVNYKEWMVSTRLLKYRLLQVGFPDFGSSAKHVIFIPGHGGGYGQFEHIASALYRHDPGYVLLSMDHGGEFSGFHGASLRDQVEFINDILKTLPPQASITLIGHSMGGVALLALGHEVADERIKLLLSVAGAHRHAPIALDSDLDRLYADIQKTPSHRYKVVSLVSSYRDHMVDPMLSFLNEAESAYAPTLDSSCLPDHLSILSCKCTVDWIVEVMRSNFGDLVDKESTKDLIVDQLPATGNSDSKVKVHMRADCKEVHVLTEKAFTVALHNEMVKVSGSYDMECPDEVNLNLKIYHLLLGNTIDLSRSTILNIHGIHPFWPIAYDLQGADTFQHVYQELKTKSTVRLTDAIYPLPTRILKLHAVKPKDSASRLTIRVSVSKSLGLIFRRYGVVLFSASYCQLLFSIVVMMIKYNSVNTLYSPATAILECFNNWRLQMIFLLASMLFQGWLGIWMWLCSIAIFIPMLLLNFFQYLSPARKIEEPREIPALLFFLSLSALFLPYPYATLLAFSAAVHTTSSPPFGPSIFLLLFYQLTSTAPQLLIWGKNLRRGWITFEDVDPMRAFPTALIVYLMRTGRLDGPWMASYPAIICTFVALLTSLYYQTHAIYRLPEYTNIALLLSIFIHKINVKR